MNYWKSFAVLLTVFSIGSVMETKRIITSMDLDIAENRSSLIPMALIMTSAFIFGAFYCWKKSKHKKY